MTFRLVAGTDDDPSPGAIEVLEVLRRQSTAGSAARIIDCLLAVATIPVAPAAIS